MVNNSAYITQTNQNDTNNKLSLQTTKHKKD